MQAENKSFISAVIQFILSILLLSILIVLFLQNIGAAVIFYFTVAVYVGIETYVIYPGVIEYQKKHYMLELKDEEVRLMRNSAAIAGGFCWVGFCVLNILRELGIIHMGAAKANKDQG